ncbi:MAG: hypothetical protein KIC54_01545 [Clostridium sp.]|nr:hypothetical protein [Clostridium sp.]
MIIQIILPSLVQANDTFPVDAYLTSTEHEKGTIKIIKEIKKIQNLFYLMLNLKFIRKTEN